MQSKHVVFVLVGLVAVVVAGLIYFSPSGSGRVDASKIIAAARVYTAELRSRGAPLPASVTLEELIGKGYLKRDDVSGFKGVEVEVYLVGNTNQPGPPVLMRARMPDGHDMVVLSDGSVQNR
ncbi:MAG TPA: hypothetical protein VN281_13940 [Verrucomicrobiae bacterium]|jgi:hypothetical protein|nr:hypothetical protein [Verrucomicrobiae bacterium]